MRKRGLWVSAAVLLIILVALSAYEFAGTKNQSAAAVLATPVPLPAAINQPAPTLGMAAANQQALSDAGAKASSQPAPGLQASSGQSATGQAAGAAAPSLLAAYEGTLE